MLLLIVVLAGNTMLNGIILRLLGYRWRESLYAGVMLAQIGEFSFVLAAVGLTENIIGQTAYQYTIAVISLSLLVSPLWIRAARSLLNVSRLANSSPDAAPQATGENRPNA